MNGLIIGPNQLRKLWLFRQLPRAVGVAGPLTGLSRPWLMSSYQLLPLESRGTSPSSSTHTWLSLSPYYVPSTGGTGREPKAAGPDGRVTDVTVDGGRGLGGRPGSCLLESHSKS